MSGDVYDDLRREFNSLVDSGVDDPTRFLKGRPAKWMAVMGERGEGISDMTLHYDAGMAVDWLYERARVRNHVPEMGCEYCGMCECCDGVECDCPVGSVEWQLAKARHLREYMDLDPVDQFFIYKLHRY